MAKPVPAVYNEMVLKYKTGEYSIVQLSKDYGIDKGNFYKYLKRNGIVAPARKEALSKVVNSLDYIEQRLTDEKKDKSADNTTPTICQSCENSDGLSPYKRPNFAIQNLEILERAENNRVMVQAEVAKILNEKSTIFAKTFQGLSALVMERSKQLLEVGTLNSNDLLNVAKTMECINNTLGVIPKQPQFAQQININQKQTKESKTTEPLDISIKVIE